MNSIAEWLNSLGSNHYAWFDGDEGVSELVLYDQDEKASSGEALEAEEDGARVHSIAVPRAPARDSTIHVYQ